MEKSNVKIGLCNPKSPDNVGAVMRAAANYRVSSVVYTGDRYPRALKYRTDLADTSRKREKNISLAATTDFLDIVPEGASVVCIELAENAIPLPEFDHPKNAFYIFGPEDGSISQDIIDKAQAVVYIPTVGCMNLAATVNVVLYDRLAKDRNKFSGNELIRESRDKNNLLKVLA